MDHFSYQDGNLHCEAVTVAAIAQQVGTPCYVYSRATLTDHYARFAKAFAALDPLICYSIKSSANLAVCRVLAECGAGMDLVSGGELHRARLAGVDPKRCVYAGVGKTDAEISLALEAAVGWFNIESEGEFENVSRIAARMNRRCQAALRVNPDVDPQTHRYTTTGKKETKFGVDLDRARAFFDTYGRDRHCAVTGIHLHIGSPVYSAKPYVQSTTKVLRLIDELAARGYKIDMLDLGGGFGADYETEQAPLASEYARELVPLLADRVKDGLKIIIEPGRTITANAGVLLLAVLYVKKSGTKTFAICDGGMNVLIRPSHYGAFHFIWPCRVAREHVPRQRRQQMDFPGLAPVDVVGPICETGDFLAVDRLLPPVNRGDLLAVFSSGAYGMVMASRYNSMPLPAEVMVAGDTAMLVRRRESYDDLTAHEQEPEVVLNIKRSNPKAGP
ncbi:MAG: diaminopimelate decarboxylase [Planctomycetota bacterium]|nr:diaminopimelate decarboxylase [Planctomycetota bacterium]